ncbi:hypothetical protein [Nonomuraea sp. NEAU-A123]|uniref:hypothetical protein n=1 Tax=Nonomuraea sp. NEAU-A123 TaxID=2839649 RepID=UPI001BE43CEF|nr:hypothetical protein [Nonomuraea sp. NEAU-A123]MBT2233991.1 hypothetical protein [Nonomuraea sp. NEAU-A123]
MVAISVSWFGVRGVLRTEFVDDVQVEPFVAQAVSDGDRTPTKTPTPTPTPTLTPSPTVTPTPTRTRTRTKPAVRKTPAPAPTRTPKNLRVVSVKGGEVAFTLGPEGCRLVSATPRGGYTAKVARNTGWIRVDLVKGEHGSGVWCISGEQRTDTWEY